MLTRQVLAVWCLFHSISWMNAILVQFPSTVVCSLHAGCVQGVHMPGFQTDKFEAYLGIPYALPPVGELRFSNPKAFPRWWGVRDATKVKADCIQKNYLVPNPVVTGDEDCLYLNVYRPSIRSKQRLPVMVYIYSGGFFSGSSSPHFHGPEYFMDTQEVILVTFGYRLGAMGFLSTNDEHMPGNFGLKDQNLVLRWVQNNIAAFGGNPNMVTIFGQSAGAVSAHMHMLSRQSEGLFRQVILLSGAANVPFAINDHPLEQARETAKLCNITEAETLSTAKLTRALRRIDAVTLVNSGDGLKYWDVDHLTNFRPIVENSDCQDAFLTQHPKVIMSTGAYKAVPLMLGLVPNEGAVRALAILENESLRNDFNANFDELLGKLMELPEEYNETQVREVTQRIIDEYFEGHHVLNNATAQGFVDAITDRGFYNPFFNAVNHYINNIDTDKYPLYLYLFNFSGIYTFADIYTGGLSSRNYGVVHCDDLIYLFRSVLFPDFARNSTDAAVIKSYVGNFVNFAKYGKPMYTEPVSQCNSSTFQPLTSTICDYQEFSNAPSDSFSISMANNFNVRRMQFWNEILLDSESKYSAVQ